MLPVTDDTGNSTGSRKADIYDYDTTSGRRRKAHVTDVQRIEVLRGANAAIFGRRGANGVLVVTTR
jgi:TonB-dependent SusC/RagA subfamily outer membrane receptor